MVRDFVVFGVRSVRLVQKARTFALIRAAVRRNVVYGARFHVGPRTVIWAPRRLTIGDDVYVGKNVTIELDGRIGDGVLIANNVGLVGRRDHDFREHGVLIRNARWVGDYPEELSLPLTVEDDVWIGFGAVVLSGIRIGRSAIIAAGSVVFEDVPPGSVMAGNPARPIRERFASEEILTEHWHALDAARGRTL